MESDKKEAKWMLRTLLEESLTIDVKTTSEYTGGDPLYEKVNTIQLKFDGDVISEAVICSL